MCQILLEPTLNPEKPYMTSGYTFSLSYCIYFYFPSTMTSGYTFSLLYYIHFYFPSNSSISRTRARLTGPPFSSTDSLCWPVLRAASEVPPTPRGGATSASARLAVSYLSLESNLIGCPPFVFFLNEI